METNKDLCRICQKSKRYVYGNYVHSYCKKCLKQYNIARRKSNPSIADKNRENSRKRLNEFRELMGLAKDQPCKDCGIKYPEFVMEFDHLPQFKKEFNISCGAFKNPDQLREEMLKCELVCANCHKIRTHTRRNGRKWGYKD